jgi:hypothetical protein
LSVVVGGADQRAEISAVRGYSASLLFHLLTRPSRSETSRKLRKTDRERYSCSRKTFILTVIATITNKSAAITTVIGAITVEIATKSIHLSAIFL